MAKRKKGTDQTHPLPASKGSDSKSKNVFQTIFKHLKGSLSLLEARKSQLKSKPGNVKAKTKKNGEIVQLVDDDLMKRMLAVRKIFGDASYDFNISSNNNLIVANLGDTLQENQKRIIEDVLFHHEDYQYSEKNGFSIAGKNPLIIIAEAQSKGFEPLSYDLRCDKEIDAIHILYQNKLDADNYPQNHVMINNIEIAGQTYTFQEFLGSFDSLSEPNAHGDINNKPKNDW